MSLRVGQGGPGGRRAYSSGEKGLKEGENWRKARGEHGMGYRKRKEEIQRPKHLSDKLKSPQSTYTATLMLRLCQQ